MISNYLIKTITKSKSQKGLTTNQLQAMAWVEK